MAVLKTTSPDRSAGAPKLLPSKTVPSSKARIADSNSFPPGVVGLILAERRCESERAKPICDGNGDGGTGRRGETATRRHGDVGMRRRGDRLDDRGETHFGFGGTRISIFLRVQEATGCGGNTAGSRLATAASGSTGVVGCMISSGLWSVEMGGSVSVTGSVCVMAGTAGGTAARAFRSC